MSEEKPDYKTEAEEMLGVGYQPAATIESPRTVQELTEDGLREYKAWGWVKVSAKFIAHIKKLKGAKLSIWQTIALSIDETGKCQLSAVELADLTGYSRSEVIESLKELDEMGYLSIKKESGRKNMYSPEFAARGGNVPTDQSRKTTSPVPPLESATDQSSPSEENTVPSSNRVKRVNGVDTPNLSLEWQVAEDLPIQEPPKVKDTYDPAKARDVANKIGERRAGAEMLALAFQDARRINLSDDPQNIKGQRKAAANMLEMHVTPEHVQKAVKQLLENGMTVIDLWSVSKTAIDLANKPAEESKQEPQRKEFPNIVNGRVVR